MRFVQIILNAEAYTMYSHTTSDYLGHDRVHSLTLYIYENKILPYVIVGFACRSCCYLKKQTIHKMMSFEVMEINIYILSK